MRGGGGGGGRGRGGGGAYENVNTLVLDKSGYP